MTKNHTHHTFAKQHLDDSHYFEGNVLWTKAELSERAESR